MKTLLIVDSHPIVLVGLSQLLTEAGYEVLKASSIEQAATLIRNVSSIDMLVIEQDISDAGDGVNLVEKLREEGYTTPAIIYTMHDKLWNIPLLMEADVEGIVLKREDLEELLKAVKEVSDGGKYRSRVFVERTEAVKSSKEILTGKDIEVLRRLSNGETTREIAEAIGLGEKAVEYHRSNILKKMAAKNMTGAIRKAIRLGIIQIN